ncbi:hypothetical protein DFP73DRAFT_524003 [Morchella snyderi]|nr:hypothetical protein DFP73DRAFT_524003 [Morchella snyderi]
MSSYNINSSSLPVTISSPNKELPSQQTNPFVGDQGHSSSPSTSGSFSGPLHDLLQECQAGTQQPSNPKPCVPIDNWWEASDDGNDMDSNTSFSDDEDDDLFNVRPSPSSYADLFKMCLNGPEPSKKRYRSGWWEDIGSNRSSFPASYTNFEDSARLPPLQEEEESGDDNDTSITASTTPSSGQLDVSDSEEATRYLDSSGSEYSGDGDDMSDISDDDDMSDISDDDGRLSTILEEEDEE